MTLDNFRTTSNPRKRMLAGIVLLVVFLIVWQIAGMFGRASSPNGKPSGGQNVAVADEAPPPAAVPPPPKQAVVQTVTPMTDREIALMTLQQETQIKYLQALNELQMLKITKDIAVTNKDISSANLDRVTAEKKIVDMLTLPTIGPVSAESLGATGTQTAAAPGAMPGAVAAPISTEVSYTLVSISQVQYRWGAVLNYRGTLYNVHMGDVLPADGSTVVAIAKDSVTLLKNGQRKKLSLVSII